MIQHLRKRFEGNCTPIGGNECQCEHNHIVRSKVKILITFLGLDNSSIHSMEYEIINCHSASTETKPF